MLTPPGRPLLVVAAALIDVRGRVLVQRRPAAGQHGGLWEFPGGKIEPGETPEAALIRELAEELAIDVAADAVVPAGFTTAADLVLLLYAVRGWRGEPRPVDGVQMVWLAPAALTELPMPPADRPLVGVVQALI